MIKKIKLLNPEDFPEAWNEGRERARLYFTRKTSGDINDVILTDEQRIALILEFYETEYSIRVPPIGLDGIPIAPVVPAP